MRAGTGGRLPLVAVVLLALLPFVLAACGAPEGGGVAAGPTRTSAVVTPTVTPDSAVGTPTPLRPPDPVNGTPSVKAGASPTPVPHRPAPAGLTQTIAAERALDGPYPPPSTLSYEDRTQAGRTGSFTWTSCDAGRCRSMHADAPGIPIPPPQERLTVPPGAVLTFAFGGKNPPTILGVTAYVLDEQSPRHAEPHSTGPNWLLPRGQRATVLPWCQAGLQVAVTADLPPAEYIIVVDLREKADPPASRENVAPYSFRVVVQ